MDIEAIDPIQSQPESMGLKAVCVLVLALLASPLIPLGADFLNYTEFFSTARASSFAEVMQARYEPLFTLSAFALTNLLSSDVWVFGLLMTLALYMKTKVIFRISASQGIALALLGWYSVRFLPLHELTQIRIALALGIWLIATTVENRWLGLLLGVAAAFTHYSAAILLPVLWAWQALQRAPHTYQRIELPLLTSGVIVLVLLGVTLQPLLESLSLLFSILDLYSQEGFGDDRVNPFSLSVIADTVLLAIAWYTASRDVRLRFWLMVLSLSLAAFYVLADFPVLAFRIREMMSICWLPYLAIALTQAGAPRVHAQLVILVNVPIYIYLNFMGAYALFPIAAF